MQDCIFKAAGGLHATLVTGPSHVQLPYRASSTSPTTLPTMTSLTAAPGQVSPNFPVLPLGGWVSELILFPPLWDCTSSMTTPWEPPCWHCHTGCELTWSPPVMLPHTRLWLLLLQQEHNRQNSGQVVCGLYFNPSCAEYSLWIASWTALG